MSYDTMYPKSSTELIKKRRITKKTIIYEEIEEVEEIEVYDYGSKPPNFTLLEHPELISIPLLESIESKEALEIDDFDLRKELAELIGLHEVPEKSEKSFEEICGIFDDITFTEDVDVVKWIKSLRRKIEHDSLS